MCEIPHHIWDQDASKLYLKSKLMFEAIIEKYSLECVFVYNFVSANVDLLFATSLLLFLCKNASAFALNNV